MDEKDEFKWDSHPTYLKHGTNTLPHEPLGNCDKKGCDKNAKYVCYWTRPSGEDNFSPKMCEKDFCDDHCEKNMKTFTTGSKNNRKQHHYYVRQCSDCTKENVKK